MAVLTLKKKTEQSKTKDKPEALVLSEKYFNSFEVIQQNNLLAIGWGLELNKAYKRLDKPGFPFFHLKRLLAKHCNEEFYREKDKQGIRYNINNEPAQMLINLKGRSQKEVEKFLKI